MYIMLNMEMSVISRQSLWVMTASALFIVHKKDGKTFSAVRTGTPRNEV